MAKLSVSEAAKRFQVSRPTLQKALKEGSISGERLSYKGTDTWQIDVSELARVYKPRGGHHPAKFTPSDDSFSGNLSGISNVLPDDVAAKIEALTKALSEAQKQAAVAEARAEERRSQIEDMRKDIEVARQEKAALLAALPKPEAIAPIGNKSGFFRFLFSRKT
ncbi:helix-turn-helix domain-containing protein [Falsigemmobacter faecalis]|uniref:DNA-binding protein n=1 Tax=Falsigemmobacter faecalis TaxID=2488730 RepID=A0A3P3D3G1_9RHOB|nr:helix-turn-helix domain-containing protein [Falsigemmobacter faecalis]RRH68324.1 DNA-binding protein [Falsigemmobacter faecalis]